MLYVRNHQRVTQESSLLGKFLESNFFTNYLDAEEKYMLLQEPFTGLGYTDLVCVVWDEGGYKNWCPSRNDLSLDDIKILHHLYWCKNFKQISELNNELGFSEKKMLSSLVRLVDANLIIKSKSEKYKARKKSDIFCIKAIVSIEAKIHDWRRALYQAINNSYYASESYTLFPEGTITENMMKEYSSSDIGVISFNETSRIIKKSKKNAIPLCLNSWLFNEYIGRMQYGN
jgi:predicted transcriptional regulator